MSILRHKMHKIRSVVRVFEENAPYDHFRNDEKGGLKRNPTAPMYVMRALAQLEYAYRLCKAGDADAAAVEAAADIVLASLESFGVAWLTPFAANAGEQVEGHAVLRLPLKKTKLRPFALKTRNRRNQK